MVLSNADSKRVLLLSLPWRLANWPSLALGELKAYLAAGGIPLDAHHLHLAVACKIGIGRYERVALGWELGEALYSALLVPEERDRLLSVVINQLETSGEHDLASWAESTAIEEVCRATEESLTDIDLSRYWLVGFSVGALQLMASLYVARLLKQRSPNLIIVFGGSGLVGDVGKNLLQCCPDIDMVVDGEGEEALLQLAQLQHSPDEDALNGICNLWFRGTAGEVRKTSQSVMPNLESVAAPNYSEYFDLTNRLVYPQSCVVLPTEASRGCAWEHRCGSQELSGCTFCGLYRNSPNYREKSLDKIISDIEQVVEQNKVLELSFVDAYLPDSYRNDLLRHLSASSSDVTLFCELRCNLNDETAALLARAGARRVQLGVESFHSGILKRIEKGVRAIDNINSIKLCEEYGIPYQYNLITNIPGVLASEVVEMVESLPMLYGFRPPSIAEFYLDRGSRIFREPQAYGIVPESLDGTPPSFLPSGLAQNRVTQYVSFRCQADRDTEEVWKLVNAQVARWSEIHALAASLGLASPLSYRDGGNFLTITDCRDGEVELLTLNAMLRGVLLACERVISLVRLEERIAELGLTNHDLETVLDELIKHRLIIKEDTRILALPMRSALPSGSSRLLWTAANKNWPKRLTLWSTNVV
jgi:ribosomal peptide maturation radical SAM protein 1